MINIHEGSSNDFIESFLKDTEINYTLSKCCYNIDMDNSLVNIINKTRVYHSHKNDKELLLSTYKRSYGGKDINILIVFCNNAREELLYDIACICNEIEADNQCTVDFIKVFIKYDDKCTKYSKLDLRSGTYFARIQDITSIVYITNNGDYVSDISNVIFSSMQNEDLSKYIKDSLVSDTNSYIHDFIYKYLKYSNESYKREFEKSELLNKFVHMYTH